MLPASGNPISFSQINTSLGQSATATVALGDATVRELFRDTQGQIGMVSGYDKSLIVFTTEWSFGWYQLVNRTLPNGHTAIGVGGDYGDGQFSFNLRVGQTLQYLIVGGGAGGDYRYNSGGGGGGGGGVLTGSAYFAPLPDGQWYTAAVGAGGVGSGTTFAGASGGTSSIVGGAINLSASGGLPSGYSGGYDYGRGGTPNGVNGGNIGGYAGTTGTYTDIFGYGLYVGSGGGGGGTSGGAGGTGAGAGGSSYQYGGNATTPGSGGGGGGWYTGGTYYYGGNGMRGLVALRGDFEYAFWTNRASYYNNAYSGST